MMISLANDHQLIDVKLLIKSHKNLGTPSRSDLGNKKWQCISIQPDVNMRERLGEFESL